MKLVLRPVKRVAPTFYRLRTFATCIIKISNMKRLYSLAMAAAICAATLMTGCGKNGQADETPMTDTGIDTVKTKLGNTLALYPMPLTVVGTEVNGRVNWILIGHTGIIGHDRILVSMRSSHYSNQGIRKQRKLSLNLVSRQILPLADYAGSVSGQMTDKSKLFRFHYGSFGTPVIDQAPVSMECRVEDIYETDGFDNFVCSIVNTYADPDMLGADGKLDYTRLKPVLFEFPTYQYIASGEVLGKPLKLETEPSMCAKMTMQPDGYISIAEIDVYPQYRDEYIQLVTECGITSLRTEPGVLTMYSMASKDDPCHFTILETYASEAAAKAHGESEQFKKYKTGTLHMVKKLTMKRQEALTDVNTIVNFVK